LGERLHIFDEIRVSDTVRSAAWIATEYNNQFDPDSFYAIENVIENPKGLVGPSEVSWYSQDWIYRNKLTIDPNKVGIDPYYKQITITTGSNSLPIDYSVSVTLDHEALVNSGKSRLDGDDIRIKYNNSGEMIELDRMLDPSSSWNSNETKIWFKTQSSISASSSNYDYYLYYGNLFKERIIMSSLFKMLLTGLMSSLLIACTTAVPVGGIYTDI